MEKVLNRVEEKICNVEHEIYENIVFQIKSKDEKSKADIKSFLRQGDPCVYHTVVEIDFIKEPMKLSRRKRHLIRQKGKDKAQEIESFNELQDQPRISISNSPLYIYGEYVKLSRNMCQTPLCINGQNKTERCVSDFTKSFEKFFCADEVKFMSCGREDIDVRCLEGRPFILEVVNPRFNLNSIEIPISLYQDVDIKNLYKVTKKCKEIINSDESCKYYALDVFSDSKISLDSVYEIKQRTPLRVLHRRADLEREKRIEVLNCRELECDEGFYYEIKIRASSGAYIKEWVTGDFGRTTPNLNSDLLNLDVIRVEKSVDMSTVIHPYVIRKTIIETYKE